MIGITLPPGVQEETTCAKYPQMEMLREIIVTHEIRWVSHGFPQFSENSKEELAVGRWRPEIPLRGTKRRSTPGGSCSGSVSWFSQDVGIGAQKAEIHMTEGVRPKSVVFFWASVAPVYGK